jgi:hypothetical protein
MFARCIVSLSMTQFEMEKWNIMEEHTMFETWLFHVEKFKFLREGSSMKHKWYRKTVVVGPINYERINIINS